MNYAESCKQQKMASYVSPKKRSAIGNPFAKLGAFRPSCSNFNEFYDRNFSGGLNQSLFDCMFEMGGDSADNSTWSKGPMSFANSDLDPLPPWMSLCLDQPPQFFELPEPPKPDTPPSRPSRTVPLYFDPIWANYSNNDFNGQSLNIHLPELKTVNIISSPCKYTQQNATNSARADNSPEKK